MSGLGFGLIGSGYMGRAHAIALGGVANVFCDVEVPRRVAIADVSLERASAAARELHFERGLDDWRRLLDDPAVDVVDICTPNHLHFDMALAALQAGKHVYCEKPLGLTVAECEVLAAQANGSRVVHGVGLNYTANPLIREARNIIRSGEIGEPLAFSGRYFEDYLANPGAPFSWRCDRALAGAGALADLGAHLINMVHYLVGPATRVLGDLRTVITERHDPLLGVPRAVENDDIARAVLELGGGATANLEISRVASGYKCGLTFEVFGTRGGLSFDQERMNELRLYDAGAVAGRLGFRTLLAGPAHGDYARFCPAPGHGLGINDLKTIEIHDLMMAIRHDRPFYPDFGEGLAVQRVIDAVERSSAAGAWCDVTPTTSVSPRENLP
jgi:predicted dehydrogenase